VDILWIYCGNQAASQRAGQRWWLFVPEVDSSKLLQARYILRATLLP